MTHHEIVAFVVGLVVAYLVGFMAGKKTGQILTYKKFNHRFIGRSD